MMVETKEKLTYEDYLKKAKEIGDLERVELIFGKFYMMAGASAEHQDIEGSIFFSLKLNIKEKDSPCSPRIAPYDVKLICEDEENVVQPDIMLFCKDEKKPCAVFEILSPSTSYKDKTVKKKLYECSGIKEYFLVDPKALTVDVFRLKDKGYEYEGCFGEEDLLKIECLDSEFVTSEFLTA